MSDRSHGVGFFDGGLGDIVRIIYQSDAYRWLSGVTSPTPVVVASGNPFSVEIFRCHRNSGNFVIYDLSRKRQLLMAEGLRGIECHQALCDFAGLRHSDIVRGLPPEGYSPIFDAPDDIDSDGHFVLQPFSGSNDARSWHPKFIERVVAALRFQPRRTFLLTRNFIRQDSAGRVVHAVEDARPFEGGNITVLDNLSVPGALNLVKRSTAYVGSWSSLHQAAWLEGKPVAVFYQPKNVDVMRRTAYAFGLDRPDCLHADYPKFDEGAFTAWVANPFQRFGPSNDYRDHR